MSGFYKEKLKALCRAVHAKTPNLITNHFEDGYQTTVILPNQVIYATSAAYGCIADAEEHIAEVIMELDSNLSECSHVEFQMGSIEVVRTTLTV